MPSIFRGRPSRTRTSKPQPAEQPVHIDAYDQLPSGHNTFRLNGKGSANSVGARPQPLTASSRRAESGGLEKLPPTHCGRIVTVPIADGIVRSARQLGRGLFQYFLGTSVIHRIRFVQ